MIFHIPIKHTATVKQSAEYTFEAGKAICGLQMSGYRPVSLTLTREELTYLLKNLEYTYKVILPAFAYKKQGECDDPNSCS